MRSNKVWDEERAAGLPGVVPNSNGSNETRQEGKEIFFELTDKKMEVGNADIGSLAHAEAVQAATDKRRDKEVTK